jgi:hypothetical protein
MYDPYRQDFNYDLVKAMQKHRDDKAHAIWQLRKDMRAKFPKMVKKVPCLIHSRLQHEFIKPTVGSLRQMARNLWAFAEEPIPHYLPCGADDAYGDRQDWARSHALAIWRTVGRFD